MTYYDILGVPFDATQDQIKKAYREQIRFFHPDIFDGSEDVARIKTQQLNEAYEVLKDPEQRRSYDAYLKLNGWYNKYNTKNRQPDPEPRQEPEPEAEPKPEPESEPDQEPDPGQEPEPEKEPEVDPERVAEAMLKQEQESKRFWRNVKIVIGAAVLIFLLVCNEKDHQRELNEAVKAAWGEGYEKGYEEGHDEWYSEGYNEGYREGNYDGYSAGWDDGSWAGYQAGYEDGYVQALTDGYEEWVEQNGY